MYVSASNFVSRRISKESFINGRGFSVANLLHYSHATCVVNLSTIRDHYCSLRYGVQCNYYEIIMSYTGLAY